MHERQDDSPNEPDALDAGSSGWLFYHWHPAVERAYQELVECLLFRDRIGTPRGMRIVGESRAGKTSFLRNALLRLRREFPTLAKGLLMSQPPAESRDVDGGLRQRYLEAAGHPAAPLYPTGKELKALSDTIWTDCTGFAWDEAHLFYSEKSPHFIKQSANLLRLTMNERKVPFIFLGTEVLDAYVTQAEELRNRFRVRAFIGRFSIKNDRDEQTYFDFLQAIADAAPVAFIPGLTEQRMLFRMFCASEGLGGNLMDLIERVINRALRDGGDVVGLEDFAGAFATEFGERSDVFNPFEEHTDDELIDEIARRAEILRTVGASQPGKGKR
jgi:hypothetical protein